MDKHYYSDGLVLNYYDCDRTLHRLDGPAIECASGNRYWYINGKRHREDGPAVEYVWGTKEWRQNDTLHRLDGPAIEHTNGYKGWYINGKHFTKKEFEKHALMMKLSGLSNG